MGIQKRSSVAAVDVAWFHSLADDASAAVAGDRLLLPEQCGHEDMPHGGLCPVHCIRPLAPLPCFFHGHDEEGYLEKLSSIYTCVHLRVCSDKTSSITSSEKYHPTMLELLGTQISSGSGASEALCRPQSTFLDVRMRSHCRQKLQHNHRTEEELPL
ncbi:hypothetical protein HGM15179_006608 [Zosterops borbonicus]|uniref:Uncharacterized protein n=1 Tax=Zosterops borbonicus TaxID=364589 RepID=A0A8K1GK47_9PASS|nr:hypothetical protein HGM15179_006608 [Zosterops borbonicus]